MIKGKIIKKEEVFKPITLEITLETLDDLETFLAKMNTTSEDIKPLLDSPFRFKSNIGWTGSFLHELQHKFDTFKTK